MAMKLEAIRPVSVTLVSEVAFSAALLLGVSFVVFLVLYAAPGDPFSALLGDGVAARGGGAQEALGWAQTWYGQYFGWLSGMVQGNFGASIRSGQPVLGQVIDGAANTLVLTVTALLVSLFLALPVAVYSAVRGLTRLSWPLTMLAYVVSSLPVFWLGYIAIFVSTEHFGYFPLGSGFSNEFELAKFLLPMLVLGVGSGAIGEMVRYLRHELSRVLDEEYIRTARAKGARVWRHAFKEGLLLPVTEILAAKVPFILGGAVIVEQIFNWPGIGRMAWQAAQDRDFPLIMGVVIASAVLVRAASLVHRIVYVFVNPRASHE